MPTNAAIAKAHSEEHKNESNLELLRKEHKLNQNHNEKLGKPKSKGPSW